MIDEERYDGLVKFDDFDECIIGTITDDAEKFVYSYVKILIKLVERDQMSVDEAREWVDFNMEGLHCEDHSPAIMYELDAP